MSKLTDIIFGIHTAFAQVGTSATQVTGETQAQLAGLLDFIVVKIPSFIAAVVVFAIFFLISKAIKGLVENKMATAFEEHKEIQLLTGRTAAAVTLIIGATVSLNIAGIDLTVIIAAAGFGIGFALRDIITNFLAGIMILAQKHFTIGDMIKVDGTLGKIIDIQARATILKAIDGTKVVVPNSQLFTKQVTSFTSNPFRRIEIGVCASYGEDIELAIKACYAVAQHTKGVLLEPKPVVLVTEWGENNVDMVVRVWVDSKGPWLQIKSNLTIRLLQAFDQMNIRYDFHRVTVDYDKDIVEEHEATVVETDKLPSWLANVKEAKAAQNNASAFKPYVPQAPNVDRPGATFLNVQQEYKQIQNESRPAETPAPVQPSVPQATPLPQTPAAEQPGVEQAEPPQTPEVNQPVPATPGQIPPAV